MLFCRVFAKYSSQLEAVQIEFSLFSGSLSFRFTFHFKWGNANIIFIWRYMARNIHSWKSRDIFRIEFGNPLFYCDNILHQAKRCLAQKLQILPEQALGLTRIALNL